MPTCTKLIKKFYNCHFTLLTLLFRAPHLHRKFQPQNFLELCLGMAVSETPSYYTHIHTHTHTHTHTYIIVPPHFTKNFSRFTPNILAVSPSLTGTEQPLLWANHVHKQRINCHIIPVSSLITYFVNFDGKNFVSRVCIV